MDSLGVESSEDEPSEERSSGVEESEGAEGSEGGEESGVEDSSAVSFEGVEESSERVEGESPAAT